MTMGKFETSHLISNCRPLDYREILFLCECFLVVEQSLSASASHPPESDNTRQYIHETMDLTI